MTKHLCSYAVKPTLFSAEECERIVVLAGGLDLKAGSIEERGGEKKVDFVGRNCELAWVQRKKAEDWGWVFERVEEGLTELNASAWNFEVGAVKALQYTSYGFGNFYASHFDNGSRDTAHRKLSMSIQLSKPSDYWGGALRLWSMNQSRVAPKGQGDLIVFPSYLMHLAKPVFRGTRRVLVSFVGGETPLR